MGRQIVTLLAAMFVLMRVGLGVGQALAVEAMAAGDRDDVIRAALEICTAGGIRSVPGLPAEDGESPVSDFGTPFCPACPHFSGIGLFVLPDVPRIAPVLSFEAVEPAPAPLILVGRTGAGPFRSRAPPVFL